MSQACCWVPGTLVPTAGAEEGIPGKLEKGMPCRCPLDYGKAGSLGKLPCHWLCLCHYSRDSGFRGSSGRDSREAQRYKSGHHWAGGQAQR